MPTEAFLTERSDGSVRCTVTELDDSELGDGDVVVAVEWSSANYKDALVTRFDGGVARRERLVPGIDLAGTVLESTDPRYRGGEAVIVHGYGLGVDHHGGFATRARVPGDWVVPLPKGLDLREAMIIGTAGFTAALSVARLEHHGVMPENGPVLVTGATGGVGAFAVALLARQGFEVVASTGKSDAHAWLATLGASRVIDRTELSRPGRPLEPQRYAAAVDCVGGATLAGALRSIRWGGAIAASGLTGGSELTTTLFPFILRAVSLIGIDSSALPLADRSGMWRRIAEGLRPADLEALVAGEVGLTGVARVLADLLQGAIRGRVLVRPGAGAAR